MPDPLVVQADGRLTDIAVAYRNPQLIGDLALPRKPVGRKSGKYVTYTKADRFTVPDDKVGPKSKPNEVDWSTGEATYECLDYGYDDFVTADEIANADLPITPLADSTEFLADLADLAHEIRVAAVVFGAGNYPAANKATLAGNDRWSVAASDPIGAIQTAIDACFLDPDTLVLGAATWGYLRKHASILNAVKPLGSVATRKGLASPQEVADLFGLDQCIVGRARYNTAKKGQTAVYARVWGAHAVLLRTKGPGGRSPVFGRVFQFGTKVAGRIDDPQRGLRGGTLVRVGQSTDEVVIAGDVAYMYTNAGDAT